MLVGRRPEEVRWCRKGRPDGVVGRELGVGDIVRALAALAKAVDDGRGIPREGVLGADGLTNALGGAFEEEEDALTFDEGTTEVAPLLLLPMRLRCVSVMEKMACERDDWAFMSVSFVRRRTLPCWRLRMTSSFELTFVSRRPDQMILPSLSSRMETVGRSETGVDGSGFDRRSSRSCAGKAIKRRVQLRFSEIPA